MVPQPSALRAYVAAIEYPDRWPDIGPPERADTIAAEVRRRADVAGNSEGDDTEDFIDLLESLSRMPPVALAASHEVAPALEVIRRHFGDDVWTYEEDGETHAYPIYATRLADLIDTKIAEHVGAHP